MKARRLGFIGIGVLVLAGMLPASAQENTPPEAGWDIAQPRYGASTGETAVTIRFREPVTAAPVTFGIPLGQVASPEDVILLDENGTPIPADFTSLGHWDSQPARWTLVSCVLDSPKAGSERQLTIRWREEAGVDFDMPLEAAIEGDTVKITNRDYAMTVSPRGIETMTIGNTPVEIGSWRPYIGIPEDDTQKNAQGEVRMLRDGEVFKHVRITSKLSEAVELQQEFYFYAGSPFVRCDARFINRSTKDVPLEVNRIVPLNASIHNLTGQRMALEGDESFEGHMMVIQRAFGWAAHNSPTREPVATGQEDNLGEWLSLQVAGKARFMIVAPYFQEMAAGEKDIQSVFFSGQRDLGIVHYSPSSREAMGRVRLRETMARTFTYWLVLGVRSGKEAALAQAVKAMPFPVYDRAHLTAMGVFQEDAVSHLFDEPALQAGLYFKRAQVPRAEYIRCSRGADPGPDKSGEGFYEIDLHAGGMVFGEVFQYFSPHPDESLVKRYHEEIGVPMEHIITGGSCTYRNGDIVLALFQEYLRSGDATLNDFARIHGQVYADVSISHAPESLGLGHYYCDWYGNPYVYERFEGLLLGALVTGDAWWFDTAMDMADYCVRAWKDGDARDGRLEGGYGGVQYRSPYVAKMLMKASQVTGEQKYADTDVRLAKWIVPVQEPDGWWRDTPSATREYRCSPIFAGYTSMGLWPLYHATKNDWLFASLMKAADFHVDKQGDVTAHNPGTFPNSYWYGNHIAKDAPIEANFATTSHWANILLQAYLATGKTEYFYCANAAWAGVLFHQNPEGGVGLSPGRNGSVWSHVMVESLPAFSAAAEAKGLPILLGSTPRQPVDAYMAKGAAYSEGAFAFDLKYRHGEAFPLRIYFPAGEPSTVALDGQPHTFTYDAPTHVLTLELPPSQQFRTAAFRVSK